jgi:hypothetical protein
MREAKYKVGQTLYNRQVRRSGVVVQAVFERFVNGEWSYALDEGHGWGGGYYPEWALSDVPVEPDRSYDKGLKVDVSSLDKWITQAARIIPEEEGGGWQPTIDMLNAVTAHRTALINHIEKFCETMGVPNPIEYGHNSRGR